jgi:hypothetical protein
LQVPVPLHVSGAVSVLPEHEADPQAVPEAVFAHAEDAPQRPVLPHGGLAAQSGSGDPTFAAPHVPLPTPDSLLAAAHDLQAAVHAELQQ